MRAGGVQTKAPGAFILTQSPPSHLWEQAWLASVTEAILGKHWNRGSEFEKNNNKWGPWVAWFV